jgi:hypothetical protein
VKSHIDAVLEHGRFTRSQLLTIADQVEASPLDRGMLAQRFRGAGYHAELIYARYGVDAARRRAIVGRFADWADEIDSSLSSSVG